MKFSIRDLLLVTVIVALAAGWWIDHRRSEIAKRDAAFPLWEKIDKLEAELDKAEKSAATAWHILGHNKPPEDF